MFQSFVKEQQLLTMLKVEIPKHLQTDWARMPKPGDRLNGLTRSTLLEIVQDPVSGVRSAVIRKAGAVRTSVTLLVQNIGNTGLGFRLRFFLVFAQLLAGGYRPVRS